LWVLSIWIGPFIKVLKKRRDRHGDLPELSKLKQE
jgi:hypothetical protein